MHDTAHSVLNARQGSAARWRLAAVGFATFLVVGAVQSLYGPSLPSVRSAFNIGTATSGWVIGAHYLGAVAGVLLSFPMEKRLAARLQLGLGLLLLSLGACLFAVIASWPAALIGPVCIGLGYGILVVVVNAHFARGFGEDNAAFLILVNACFGLGAVVGPLLYAVFWSGQFRPAFLLIAVLAAVLVVPAWSVEEQPSAPRPLPLPAARRFPHTLAAFVLLFLLYTALETDTSGWMATHLRYHGYSPAATAGLTSAFWIAFTLGRVISVPVSRHHGSLRMIVGGLSGVIILFVAATFGAVLPVLYILIGLLLAPIFPVGFAWMHTELRGVPGTAPLALLGALVGGLVFPVLVGALLGATSPDALPLALVAIAALAIVVASVLSRLLDERSHRSG